MHSPESRVPLVTFWALAFAAVAVVAPFSVRGVACGHDLVFHVNSWLEVAQQWRAGIFFPRWAANANYGAGEPRFLFYPPLSWLLGGALGSFIPWQFVPVAFDVCAVMGAGWVMFVMAREWFEAPEARLIAVAYALNPYLLLTIYARSAFGELLASCFFPLLVLWIVRERPARRMVVPLALTTAAIWLTNVPAAIIASYFIVVLLAIVTVLRRNSRVFAYGVIAIALGMMLAAFYIVPVLYEKNWITMPQLLAEGGRPEQSFLFARSGDPDHDLFLRSLSWLAAAEAAVTGLALFGARRWRRRNPRLWWALTITALLAFLLIVPLAAPAYRFMPDLRFVQFPWRWLLVLGVAYAVFVASALPAFRGRLWLYALACLAVVLVCNRQFQPECDPAETPFMIANLYHTGYGYMGTDEYTPAGADNYEIKPDFPEYRLRNQNGQLATDVRVRYLRDDIDRKHLTVDSPQPVQLELRLMNYPAWRVKVNGRQVVAQPDRPTGRMVLPLSGGHSDVNVRFTRTPDRWAGDAISLAAALLLSGLSFLPRFEVH